MLGLRHPETGKSRMQQPRLSSTSPRNRMLKKTKPTCSHHKWKLNNEMPQTQEDRNPALYPCGDRVRERIRRWEPAHHTLEFQKNFGVSNSAAKSGCFVLFCFLELFGVVQTEACRTMKKAGCCKLLWTRKSYECF